MLVNRIILFIYFLCAKLQISLIYYLGLSPFFPSSNHAKSYQIKLLNHCVNWEQCTKQFHAVKYLSCWRNIHYFIFPEFPPSLCQHISTVCGSKVKLMLNGAFILASLCTGRRKLITMSSDVGRSMTIDASMNAPLWISSTWVCRFKIAWPNWPLTSGIL